MENKLHNCSLIISTYNWVEALDLVLKSVILQTVAPKEVIIADDGSKEETKNLIERYKKKMKVPLIHIWHEDKGFRLAEIRNKAIKVATTNYIVQIDGDVVLHKKFIQDHLTFAKRGTFVRGGRVRLGQEALARILKTKNIDISVFDKDLKSRFNGVRLPLLSKLVANFKKEYPFKMLGCNMAFWKDNFIDVNGYANDLTGWGHEDSELAARFINIELKKTVIKHAAICYHLYHKENSKNNEEFHNKRMRKIIDLKITKAENGIKEV